jgi:multicomponent Na+:H+ antiporter subunit E
MRYTLSLGGVLFAVWLLWSGHFDPFLIIVGALSSLAVVLLARRMGIVDRESAPIEVTLGALGYLPWLAWQIVKANLQVARRILDPRLPIHPSLIRVRAGQRTDLGRVIYANSITLTPGTVSVRVEDEEITVHALTAEAADELRGGEMERRVRRLEGDR